MARRMPLLDQQLGRAEALLVLEMVRDHRLAGAQREAGRRGEIGPDLGLADDARAASRRRPGPAGGPRRAGAPAPCRIGAQALGGEPGGPVEQLGERRALERQHAELGQELLLPHALAAARARSRLHRARSPSGGSLDHGLRRIVSASAQGKLIQPPPSRAQPFTTGRRLGASPCRRGKCTIIVPANLGADRLTRWAAATINAPVRIAIATSPALCPSERNA